MALLCCIVIIITAGQLKKYQFRAQGLVTFPCVCHKQWHLILNVPEIHQSTNASIPVIYMLHSRASTIAQAIGRTLVIQRFEISAFPFIPGLWDKGYRFFWHSKRLWTIRVIQCSKMCYWQHVLEGKKDHWNRFCLFIFYTKYSASPPRQIQWYHKIWKMEKKTSTKLRECKLLVLGPRSF